MSVLAAALVLMATPPKLPAKPVEPPPAVSVAPVLAGGYTPLSPKSPELQKPLRAALAAIAPAKSRSRAQIIAAQRQVVAGTNYRLTLQLRDGSRWQAVVWHRLDRQYQVTEATRLD